MSNIKINDVPQRIQYLATAGQTQFTIPFPFFQNNYVYVWLNGIQLLQGGAPGQYVVTGAGSPSGGLATLNTPANLNDILTIEGIMPIDRTSIYSATISNLTGSDLNGDFNREVVMLQQLNTVQSFLQLQYPPWTVISQDLEVTTDRYIPILPPGHVWRKNMTNTAIEPAYIPDGGFAPDSADYWISSANSELPNAVDMHLLGDGILKQNVVDDIATPSIALNDVDYYGPGMTGFLEAPAGVKDINSNVILVFQPFASAVNYIAVLNADTTNAPGFNAMGDDASVDMGFATKAAGIFQFYSQAEKVLIYHTGTNYQRSNHIWFSDTAGDFNYTFPDANGTIVLEQTSPEFNNLYLTGAIIGSNGFPVAAFDDVPMATDYFQFTAGILDQARIDLISSATDASFVIAGKGVGGVLVGSNDASCVVPFGMYNGTNKVEYSIPTWTGNRVITVRDLSGTMAFLSDISSTPPTQQRFTSGSGTYTTPTNPAPLYIRVRMVGGGGGGSASGTATGTPATSGGNSSFGTLLLACDGGAAAIFGLTGGGGGGAGGSATIASPAYGSVFVGGNGSGNAFKTVTTINLGGSSGGASMFGGAGGGGQQQVAGSAAGANTGGGGGGAGGGNALSSDVGGNGGGAGGGLDAIIISPDPSYSYGVGAGGTGGTAGTSGFAGGNGGSGYIEVTEYYQ